MINYQAFDAHYPWREQLYKAFEASKRAALTSRGQFLFVLFIVAIVGFTLIGAWVGIIAAFIKDGSSLVAILVALSTLPTIGFIALSFYGRYGRRLLQIEQFCADNGLGYTPRLSVAGEQGALFQKGHSRVGYNGISGITEGNGFLLFEYRYTTGSGKNQTTHYFKTAKIRLAKKFPHIFLDNKKDGSLGSFEFDRSQMLQLEGNFNKYFSVYGPKEYEIEVLQILNPKVMQTLLDINEPVDIEIHGEYLYLYDKGRTFNKTNLQALFAAIQAIVQSTESAERSFSMPDQIGDYKPILKKSIWPAVFTAIFIAIWLLTQLSGPILSLIFGE